MTPKMDFKNYRCKDCSLVISKCKCDAIDIIKKTDIIMAFLTYDGEYSNCRGDKKLRNEFFEYFKPKPKIKFIKKKQLYGDGFEDCDSQNTGWRKCDKSSKDACDECKYLFAMKSFQPK